MPLETKVRQALERALNLVEEQEARGPRLTDDARRLWGRVRGFIDMGLISGEVDLIATELACYALQLPWRQATKVVAGGKPGRTTLRGRAEQAADMMTPLLDKLVAAPILARATQILLELPERTPDLDDARLLSDAVNLEDFGVSGMILQTIQLSRQGSGLHQVAEGCEKRDLYGYWEARLKDSFHFDSIRKLAGERVENARKAAALLLKEIREDLPPGA